MQKLRNCQPMYNNSNNMLMIIWLIIATPAV